MKKLKNKILEELKILTNRDYIVFLAAFVFLIAVCLTAYIEGK